MAIVVFFAMVTMASMGLFVLSLLRFHYDCGIVTGDVCIVHLDAARRNFPLMRSLFIFLLVGF